MGRSRTGAVDLRVDVVGVVAMSGYFGGCGCGRCVLDGWFEEVSLLLAGWQC